jgi:hypothetical protein
VQWLGQIGCDPDFVIFSSPIYGIRAMARILRSYKARGIVTLAGIIKTWAPPSENNTAAYISFVESVTGLRAGNTVAEKDYPKLIEAMTRKENSINPYSPNQYYAGIAAANSDGSFA